MTTITIPRQHSKAKELVGISKQAYEQFLMLRKMASAPEYTPTLAEKQALARARKRVAQGKFFTLEQFKHELDFKS